MPYTAAITRTNPACVLLLIDQSGSMAEPYTGLADQSKAQAVADAVNRVLQNLVLRCAKADQVRDYFQVGVIGYGLVWWRWSALRRKRARPVRQQRV